MGSLILFPLPPFLLSSLLFLILASSVRASVNVYRSNNTQDLAWTHSVRYRFKSDSGPLSGHSLVPLTATLVELTHNEFQAYQVPGILESVNPGNSLSLQYSQIACISCDPSAYPGVVGVDDTVNNVVTAPRTAEAVILYSTTANHCTFFADVQTTARYPYVFTLADSAAVSALLHDLQSTRSNHSVTIASTMSSFNSGPPSGNPSGNNPNTAMIILYSITGIITALFLGIIITGAVRAHRHPERYGPRRVAGRARQSRARGIARAMLETLPIVKFDDTNHDGADAAKRDVEMTQASENPTHEHSPPPSPAGETTPPQSEPPTSDPPVDEPIMTAPDMTPNAAPDPGNLECPICTDDFIKGQDLRVLPCNHQFHPECVDPWLVNVSGTCPLCRIDLNPTSTEEPAVEDGEQGERLEAPESATTHEAELAEYHLSHRRLSVYLHGPLNARRMRYATVEERLAALRRVREATQGDGTHERPPRSRRLSARFRDRFRIRTRAHGEGMNADAEAATTMPAAPAAAHTAGPPNPDA